MPAATTQNPYPRRIFWLLALCLFGWAFWSLSEILLPVVMGAFVAFALWPIVVVLPEKWPRWVRSFVALFVAGGVITAFFLILVPSLWAQGQQIAGKFPGYLVGLTDLGHSAEVFLARHNVHVNVSDYDSQIRQRLQEAGLAIVGWVGSSLPGALSSLLQLVVGFWVALYGLLEGPEIITWVNEQLPLKARNAYRQTMTITGKVLRDFLKGMLILGLIIGAAVGVGAWLLGMPYALSIGLVAGALEAVPNIGPIIAGCFAGILAFAQSPTMALKMIGLFVVIQALENNIIVPRVLGGSLEVHPMAIFLAALIGAKLFGLAGLFLAGPAVAVAWRLWQAAGPGDDSDTVADVAANKQSTP